jgi:hypothetical protein
MHSAYSDASTKALVLKNNIDNHYLTNAKKQLYER